MKELKFKHADIDFEQKITKPGVKKKRSRAGYTRTIENPIADLIRESGWAINSLSKYLGVNKDAVYHKLHHPTSKMTMEDIFLISYLTEVPYNIVMGACYSVEDMRFARNTGKRKANSIKNKHAKIAAEKKLHKEKDFWD